MKKPYVSVVVPVYNEEKNLPILYARLTQVLDALEKPYEIVLTNDGSTDQTQVILQDLFEKRPEILKVVELNGNYGQHMAIMAGLEQAVGDVVMTMDADLQNPPEEIPNLLAKIDEGFDYVGSFRKLRHDNAFRTYASKLVNWVRGKVTNIHMKDHGCMIRAYKAHIIKAVLESREHSTMVPVLAYKYASNPTEVGVEHVAREGDESKYDIYKLIRLNFDLFTGFSSAPLHAFTFFGFATSIFSFLLMVYMIGRRLIVGPEAEGLFTLFAILFFLVSVCIAGIGLVGEYVGRIYDVVRQRPRYLVKNILKKD